MDRDAALKIIGTVVAVLGLIIGLMEWNEQQAERRIEQVRSAHENDIAELKRDHAEDIADLRAQIANLRAR